MLRACVRRFLVRAADGAREGGQAMLIVLASLALMATIPLVVIATSANQLPLTTGNLNWNAAYQAAQAGLNDYIQHLDADQTYAEWSGGHTGCSNTPPVNNAFCGWTTLATNPNQWYEYSATTTGGKLWLTVSGLAGASSVNGTSYTGSRAVVRTFHFPLTPQSTTLDDLYWTNYEQVDPSLVDGSGNTLFPGLGHVEFNTSDVLNGPVYSNDDFYMCGSPTFNSSVTSANDPGGLTPSTGFGTTYGTTDGSKGGPYWVSECQSGTPQTGTSSPQFNQTSCAQPAKPACVNYGTNPETIAPPADDVTPAKNTGCYINDSGSGVTFTLSTTTLTWSGGTLANSSGDPNTSAQCGSGGASVTIASLRAALFYVNGNIIINGGGHVQGFLTLVSSGNITIDGSIKYPCSDVTWTNTNGGCSGSTLPTGPLSDTSDALGLIAQNSVILNAGASDPSTEIDGAIAAISDSFYNTNYATACASESGGSCNTLTLFGSVAQNYRGPVGVQQSVSGSTYGTLISGYTKAYYYDSSLQVLWPPFFLAPLNATWHATSYAECVPGQAYATLTSSTKC